ncbi:MAG TPA: hypothetical protein VFW38_04020 [Solirubrobacteraceae bacterium]|nr:hypothetical protein [Solirubrobacteraceae bacterium]
MSAAGLTLTVRFHLEDERAARELAAEMIERAHELANTPDSECDVDCDVQWAPPEVTAPDRHSDL